MGDIMAEYDFMISLVPALGAVALSIFNWYKLKQAGVIKPLRIVNYGLWSVKSGERKVKNLFLPVTLENIAMKSGLVTDISISFIDGTEEKPLDITRRIEMDMPGGLMGGMTVNDFRIKQTKILVPFYPVNVPGQEGRLILLDCVDRWDAITLDKQLTCKIDVTYGYNKKSSIKFPFIITSESWDSALDHIKWFRP
ncbi:MAG: hypothetical protein HeimC3_10790 [Candidatus Heimdallarchaeota archaeon LC_3]|nr:MAG: hypothetical protein HeimC3_10790 [Candidatus Heimdallarchaeota archaeon LC_3]